MHPPPSNTPATLRGLARPVRPGQSAAPGRTARLNLAGAAALATAMLIVGAAVLTGCAGAPSAGPQVQAQPRPPAPARTPAQARSATPAGPAASAATAQPLACANLAKALARRWPALSLERPAQQGPDRDGHPRHCLLRGVLGAEPGHRPGAPGAPGAVNPSGHGAIGFEIRLPEVWNGRLLHQANGGTDGVLEPAYGRLAVLDEDALQRGFAVLSGDGGHRADDPAQAHFGLARGLAFGLDPQARRDMAYGAMEALWPLAQAAVLLHYGRPASHNYLAGCGNGGRLGLVAASRFADRYDGILAGAPALYWPRAALQHPWDHQQWRSIGPDTRQALSAADLQLVAEQVVARCDGLDMLTDGMVNHLARCQAAFQPASLQCSEANPNRCLSAAQVRALQQVMAGPQDSAGQALYTDWPYDAGLGSARWRHWRIASDITGWQQQPVGAVVGAASLAFIFSTPPQPLPGTVPVLLRALERYDFNTDPARLRTPAAPFDASAEALMSPADADRPRLAAFEQHGGKMIIYHGSSDPAFSVHATLGWAERLHSALGLARAQATARVFAVPGMGHCHGGPATDRFDALGALVDWVEQGRPPAQLHARVDPANPELPSAWARHRSRPLCPWPQIARYRGGDVELARSFSCAMP